MTSDNFDGYYYWDSEEEMFVIIDRGGAGNYVPTVTARLANCTN